ncbi:MAG: hypothetical protein NWE95_08680 [Candidatus Bathyarchaeota archaeon]|nr:hypothetical protein [Candidatus Bathyarchaeota archaeon]
MVFKAQPTPPQITLADSETVYGYRTGTFVYPPAIGPGHCVNRPDLGGLYRYNGDSQQYVPAGDLCAGAFDTLYIKRSNGATGNLSAIIVDVGCTVDASGVEANHFCSIQGNNVVTKSTGSTNVYGVPVATVTYALQSNQGQKVKIIKSGRAQVYAAETLNAGDKVTSNNVGKATKTNGIYTVIQGAAANNLATIWIN